MKHADSKQSTTGLMTCPKCKKPSVKIFTYQSKDDHATITAIGCRDRNCGFVYWNPVICGKRLSAESLELLVKNGITDTIDFISKEGKGFNAKLKLKDDFTVQFTQ
jgi:hypothetical protein